MDKQIKEAFQRWLKGNPLRMSLSLTLDQVKRLVAEKAFEQGWGEGVTSMLTKADAALSKMGHVKAKPDTPETVQMKCEQASRVMGTIGGILKKRKEAGK